MINAEVSKVGTEPALSVIRKFSRRVQGANVIKTVRAKRYYSRTASTTTKRKGALKRIERREVYRQNVKEGKIIETQGRRGGHQQREQQVTTPPRLGEGTPIAR
jgi:ribosomal protein S21